MAYQRVQKSFGQSSSQKKQFPIVPPLNEQQTQSDSPPSSQVNLSRIPGKEERDAVRRSRFEKWANAPQKQDSPNTSHQDWHPPFGQHFGEANKTEDRKIRMEPSEERYSLVVTAGELTLKLGSAVKGRVKYSIEGGDIFLLDIENVGAPKGAGNYLLWRVAGIGISHNCRLLKVHSAAMEAPAQALYDRARLKGDSDLLAEWHVRLAEIEKKGAEQTDEEKAEAQQLRTDIENFGKTLRANTPSVVMASLREPATKYLTDNKIQNGG